MEITLAGRTALITGGSSELGRVMSHTLAACGADVAIHYNSSEDRARQLASEIADKGRRAIAVHCEVDDRQSVERMRNEIAEQMGEPDIVVTNAVSLYPWRPVLDQDSEAYESLFRSCVLQNVHMAQVFAPAMIRKKWGRIIAINTECAMQNLPTQSAYVSGKRGMDGVLRVLAKEIGEHGVTVNQVAPGWTISDNDRAKGTEKQEHYDKNVPLKRRGEDQDIANAVAFLASDLAGFISGVYLPVCGGNVMPAI